MIAGPGAECPAPKFPSLGEPGAVYGIPETPGPKFDPPIAGDVGCSMHRSHASVAQRTRRIPAEADPRRAARRAVPFARPAMAAGGPENEMR
ncbi:hypothetical protein ColTof3_10887 [Colletotrichum tofieldiae]|nr:hypothetical protein ColTof3_10887 [Colletotrichum tofieldiae]